MPPNDPHPALGRIASGIYILTAGTGDRATGMLASWVMQAGFEPPMLTVAVNSQRYVAQWIAAGEPFVINIVGAQQQNLLAHFGRGFAPEEPAFEGLSLNHCARGVPILADCLGHLECEPISHLDSEDHQIFLAKVARGSLTSEGEPMVHLRKSGAHY